MAVVLALAIAVAATACRDLSISPERVIAIEVSNPAPRVAVGDTFRLSARALNGAGAVVSGASVTWAPVDTGLGFTLVPATGFVTAIAVGAWRVRAEVETLRSDPITVTVTAVPAP